MKVLLLDEKATHIPLYQAAGFDVMTCSTPKFRKDFGQEPKVNLELQKYHDWNEAVSEFLFGSGCTIIMSSTDEGIPTATEIAENLKLTGPCTKNAIPFFNDKLVMRDMLSKIGFDWEYASLEDSDRFCLSDNIEDRYVIKPKIGSGSRGVFFIKAKELRTHRQSVPQQIQSDFIVERFIEGPEYTLDTFSLNGDIHLLGVGQTFFEHNSPLEMAHSFGDVLPQNILDRALSDLNEILNNIGYSNGPGHCEFRLTSAGCVFLEFHPRPGGAGIPRLCQLTTGHSLTSSC